MARSAYIETHSRLLAVDLSRLLLPESFERALNHLLDHAVELSHFDARFRNDSTGAADCATRWDFRRISRRVQGSAFGEHDDGNHVQQPSS